MTDPSDTLPARLLAASKRLAGIQIARLENAPVHMALLCEAADALEQRLGLLRDTERRLEETVAKLSALLDAARKRATSVELALRKRQATVDRQGNELGRLRAENAGLRAIRGLSRGAPCDEAAEIGRLTSTLADETRTANMFRRRCERYERWFTLPPDQRHPLGPEFTADIKPAGVLNADIRASLGLAEEAHRDEDGYLLCTSCRRFRASGRPAVQGCSDCLWLNEGEQERPVPDAEPQRSDENTPDTAGQRIQEDAFLQLFPDQHMRDLAIVSEAAGRIEVMPESDPAVLAALGVQGPFFLDRDDEVRRVAEGLGFDPGAATPEQCAVTVNALHEDRPAPRPLAVGPITVVAHYCGDPCCIAVIDPSTLPRRICGDMSADVSLSLRLKRLDIFERCGELMAATISYQTNIVAAIDPLFFGRSFDFEGMVLHFLPGGPLDASLYEVGGSDGDDLLPLTEFRAAIARLASLPEVAP